MCCHRPVSVTWRFVTISYVTVWTVCYVMAGDHISDEILSLVVPLIDFICQSRPSSVGYHPSVKEFTARLFLVLIDQRVPRNKTLLSCCSNLVVCRRSCVFLARPIENSNSQLRNSSFFHLRMRVVPMELWLCFESSRGFALIAKPIFHFSFHLQIRFVSTESWISFESSHECTPITNPHLCSVSDLTRMAPTELWLPCKFLSLIPNCISIPRTAPMELWSTPDFPSITPHCLSIPRTYLPISCVAFCSYWMQQILLSFDSQKLIADISFFESLLLNAMHTTLFQSPEPTYLYLPLGFLLDALHATVSEFPEPISLNVSVCSSWMRYVRLSFNTQNRSLRLIYFWPSLSSLESSRHALCSSVLL